MSDRPSLTLSLEAWQKLALIGHAADPDDETLRFAGIRLRIAGGMVTAHASNRIVLASHRVDVPVSWEWEGFVRSRQALLVYKDIRSLARFSNRKQHPDETIQLQVTVDDTWVEVGVESDGTFGFEDEQITRRLDVIELTNPPQFDGFLDAFGNLPQPEPDPPSRFSLNLDLVAVAAKTLPGPATLTVWQLIGERRPVMLTSSTHPHWWTAIATGRPDDA